MSGPDFPESSLALVWIREAAPALYSLETAAHFGGVHPEMLRHYWRLGLFGKARGEETPMFDAEAVRTLRRFEHYRRIHGIDRRTLRLLFSLWQERERLQTEIRLLRAF